MSKITNILNIKERRTYSFEITSDVLEDDIKKISIRPDFFSITWHAKVHECKDLEIGPLKLASFLRKEQYNVLLHLSCDMLRKEYLNALLEYLKTIHVRNILALLGENYNPETSDFKNTKELIIYIREKYPDYFCVGVVGFPGCSERKMTHLKEKVDSGAEFIITQAFFEPTLFNTFAEKCVDIGIKVPIIPGLFYFESHEQLSNFVNKCRIKVADDLNEMMKNSNETINFHKDMMTKLMAQLGSNHYHFFTLNKILRVCSFIESTKL